MSLIPAFEPGIWNAWLFMIIFLLQWLAVLAVPKHISERTGHPSEIKRNRKDNIIGWLTEIVWIGAILYSIFLPFHTGTAWFYIGLSLFTIGLIVLVSATVTVARTPADKPFTGGVYRFSRHPMYLSMMLIYAGVSIATLSWLFGLITVITFFLQSLQMSREELYCSSKFGSAYLKYKERTPRWLGISAILRKK